MKKLEIKTAIQILKPAGEVFEAIVNPDHMSHYFIAGATGRMESGREIFWSFPEFDFEFPVQVEKTEQGKYVSFFWESDGERLLVEITLEEIDGNSTLVTVTEKDRDADDAGIAWLQGNTAGWANFLACLKAYLEYGINLRKGAFEYLRKKKEQ
jgi:uncharacterized protein YndB with AHSA1/START domain